MYSLILLLLTACVFSLLITPVVRDWSTRAGLVDRPGHPRKQHRAAIPRTGGVALLISYAGAYALWFGLPLTATALVRAHIGSIVHLLPAVVLVFLTGLMDDWRDLRPWQKLAGEVAAAAWVYAAGVRISSVAGLAAPWWCSLLLTVGWLILCTNAFNLIDGVDGLATGVGLTATLATLIAGLLNGDWMLGLATAPLAGCLVGFLRYNFNPASIFLGDSGSLLIGFLLGSYAIIWSQKSVTILGMAAPGMVLALPLLEVGLSIVRRFLRNEPILSGDRGHIHHRLLDRGFTPRKVALLLYSVCGIGAVVALLQMMIRNRFAGLLVVLSAAAAWGGIHYLEYAEFKAVRRLCARFRPMLSVHLELQSLEHSLRTAGTAEQCWCAIQSAARILGYSRVTARLAGIRFSSSHDPARQDTFWQMRLNLSAGDYVNITQHEEPADRPVFLIPFIDVVRKVLPEKVVEIRRREAGRGELSLQLPTNSITRTVMSSDCAAPSVNCATPS